MKLFKFSILALFISLSSCSYDQDDNLSATIDIDSVEVIPSNSDLYENIEGITNDETRPDESIACIDFIYPLTLFIFDDSKGQICTTFFQ